MGEKKHVAAKCRSCERELRRSDQDTDENAVKRAKWSNTRTVAGETTGVCRSCNKKGRF